MTPSPTIARPRRLALARLLALLAACWPAQAPRAAEGPLPLPDGGLLCHPRPAPGDSLPELAESRRLFVNGHLGQADSLRAGGHPLPVTADGRFAGLAPWPADRVLRLELWGRAGRWTLELPLAAPASAPENHPAAAPAAAPRAQGVEAPDLGEPWEPPLRLRLDGGPLSTIPGGSYWIFPQQGTEWVADRREGDWWRLPLTPDLAAWVPVSRAQRLGPAPPGPAAPRRLGPAVQAARVESGDLKLSLAVDGGTPPLWREEGDPGGSGWRLVLSQTQGRLDWVELDGEDGLRALDWEPLPGTELALRATLAPGAFQGHSVRWEPGRLLITFHRRAPSIKGARIMLDPGHGGRESGCIGASGTREKDLALAFARELAAELGKAGAEVRLTREDDRMLGLGERVALAREWRADFLLSLHYNSVGEDEDPWRADGFMVFSWSPWAADAARLLHGELVRRLSPGPRGQKDRGGMRDRGLHWRSLGVCRHHGCPAILLEAGSLVHPGEEERLLDEGFRRRQARAIRHGIEAWFESAARAQDRDGAGGHRRGNRAAGGRPAAGISRAER